MSASPITTLVAIACLLWPRILWALTPLDDSQLASVSGQSGSSPVQMSIEADTVRLYFDTYVEVYAEVDSIRAGYYYKDQADLTTRKSLNYGELNGSSAPTNTDPRVQWGDTFDYNADGANDGRMFRVNMGTNKAGNIVWSDWEVATRYEVDEGSDGNLHRETVDIPWVDDDNYMYKYMYSTGHAMWADGAQGDNDTSLPGILFFLTGYDTDFSGDVYRNRNYLDWDLSLDNVRLGIDPENPAVINGLVVRLKYDDISSADRQLTDIIIGTNDMQGDLNADFMRLTGIANPKLPHQARQPILQEGGTSNSTSLSLIPDLAAEFNITPGPVLYQRDSHMSLVDQLSFARNFKQQDEAGWFDAVPDNPLDNTQHSGVFIRIGLDRDSAHYGFNLVAGYNERVASAFEYRGEHLNESMYRWWNGEEARVNSDGIPVTQAYPDTLSQVWSNDPVAP